MEISRKNIMEIVHKCNIKAEKDFSQNFLTDANLAKRITDALDIQKDEKVLEIGPGLGSLTHFLVEHDNQINAVEFDENMITFLKVVYQDTPNLKIIFNDMRKEDVSSYDKIISNLPYNITTEAVTYLLLNAVNCKKMILMCQKEAYNRFKDITGKEYGPVSVLLHLLGTTKQVAKAPKGCFYPQPKVDSLVFEIDINPVISREEAIATYKLAKVMFLNRRKTMYNSLRNYLKDADKATKVLDNLGISLNARPQELQPMDFFNIKEMLKTL